MMIPIPRAGRLRAVRGQEAATAVPDVEEVTITAHTGQEIVPLPEGWQYLGFIFARAQTPDRVEHALRDAHSRLTFEID
jgi:L-aminoacid ligase-like protein